jgi:hypothetical protein
VLQVCLQARTHHVVNAELARKFLAGFVAHKEFRALLSDERFTVDGTQGGNNQRPDSISLQESALSKENESAQQDQDGSGRPARLWLRLSGFGGYQ